MLLKLHETVMRRIGEESSEHGKQISRVANKISCLSSVMTKYMFKHMCYGMTAKTITIREDVYRMLLSIKGTNESFSSFFERLVKSRSNLDKLRELRGSVKFKNKDMFLKELSEKRREIRY